MARVKFYNKETGKWEYADAAYGSSGGSNQPLTFTGAVNATYDGSQAITVTIPSGGGNGGGSGGSTEWRLLLDTTLAEDVVNVCCELDTPVQEFLIKGKVGGDGTNRALTLFSVTKVGYGVNMQTFENVLRTDDAINAHIAIYGVAFQNYARFVCDHNAYNSDLSKNTPLQGGSMLAFNEATSSASFIGTAFKVINIGCWEAGTSGIIKAGSRIEIWGR